MTDEDQVNKPAEGIMIPKPTRITIRIPSMMLDRLSGVADHLGPGFSITTIARMAIIEGLPGIEGRYLRQKTAQKAQQTPPAAKRGSYGQLDEDAAATALSAPAPGMVAGAPDTQGQRNPARCDGIMAAIGASSEGPPRTIPLEAFGPQVVDLVTSLQGGNQETCKHDIRWDAQIPCPDCALMPPPAPDVPDEDLEIGAELGQALDGVTDARD